MLTLGRAYDVESDWHTRARGPEAEARARSIRFFCASACVLRDAGLAPTFEPDPDGRHDTVGALVESVPDDAIALARAALATTTPAFAEHRALAAAADVILQRRLGVDDARLVPAVRAALDVVEAAHADPAACRIGTGPGLFALMTTGPARTWRALCDRWLSTPTLAPLADALAP